MEVVDHSAERTVYLYVRFHMPPIDLAPMLDRQVVSSDRLALDKLFQPHWHAQRFVRHPFISCLGVTHALRRSPGSLE